MGASGVPSTRSTPSASAGDGHDSSKGSGRQDPASHWSLLMVLLLLGGPIVTYNRPIPHALSGLKA